MDLNEELLPASMSIYDLTRVRSVDDANYSDNEEVNKNDVVPEEEGSTPKQPIRSKETDNHKGDDPESLNIPRANLESVWVENRLLEGTHPAILIFPEEIWMIIFDNLTDWKDLLNCSKACMLFHRQLHPRKATFLFGQVFPDLFEHLPGHDVLKCRSICKEWNLGVDNFFENHPSVRPQNESRLKSLQCPSFVNPVFDKQLGEVYRFSHHVPGYLRKPNCLESSMVTSRNPFVGRAFHIELPVAHDWENEGGDPEEDAEGRGGRNEDYWASLYTFLEDHGKHIFYVTLKFSGCRENPTDFTVQKMNSFLTFDLFQLIPNLRSICFDRGLHDFPMVGVGSLPPAPKLETIEFNGMFFGDTKAHPLRIALLKKYAGQLKMLCLQRAYWMNELIPVEFPKLTDFHIVWTASNYDLESFSIAEMPQLRRLVLWDSKWTCRQWGSPVGCNEVTIDGLLDAVATLSATTPLDTLHIRGEILEGQKWPGERPKPLQTVVPKLAIPPTLKTLELKYSPRTCHSFLLRFPFLENLKLFWEDQDPSKRVSHRHANELVEVNKYIMGGEVERRRGIYKSNIWRMMSRLKVFSYQREAYSRNEYERYMRRQFEQQRYNLN